MACLEFGGCEMKVIIFTSTLLAFFLTGALFLFANELHKKPDFEFGYQPCTQAIEEIAEVVNERLEP